MAAGSCDCADRGTMRNCVMLLQAGGMFASLHKLFWYSFFIRNDVINDKKSFSMKVFVFQLRTLVWF